MNLIRIMVPEPKDSKNKLAALARGAIARLFDFLDYYLIPAAPAMDDVIDYTQAFDPHAPPARTDGPTMQQIYVNELTRHIKRVEHVLRCLLFFLAAKLIADPDMRARLATKQPVNRTPPQRRPYDPEIMVQITKPEPKSYFVSLPYASNGKSGSGKRRRHTPLDWKEVEIAHLMARMEAFPKVLNSLDRRAEALAARLLSGEIALTKEALNAPAIHSFDHSLPFERERRRPKHCPVFLRHLSHWLPPPELYGDCDDDDRETYNKLHSLAYEAAGSCVFF